MGVVYQYTSVDQRRVAAQQPMARMEEMMLAHAGAAGEFNIIRDASLQQYRRRRSQRRSHHVTLDRSSSALLAGTGRLQIWHVLLFSQGECRICSSGSHECDWFLVELLMCFLLPA